MAYKIYRRAGSEIWYIDFGTIHGERIRRSAETAERKSAEAFAKHHSAKLWQQEKLDKKPGVTWDYAVIQWIKANGQKRSLDDDKQRLRRLSAHLAGRPVSEISRAILQDVVGSLGGIADSTRNRYLAAGSVILNFAHDQGWRPDSISLKRFQESNKRIRYLTPDEASRLLAELPDYLRAMAEFSLSTGLRESNVRLLEWSNVDLGRSIAWVHGDEAKAGKSLAVPLNASAMAGLKERQGLHWKWVFDLDGRPLYQCNNTAWKSALRRAGISNFRWHDLRHTWASWHVQNGTSLYDLKTLGGWASMVMVERYAHMSHERVAAVSGNIDGLILSQIRHSAVSETPPKNTQLVDFTGRSWQARTADQRIKSPKAHVVNKPDSSSKIIDLRDKNAQIKKYKSAKNRKISPGSENNLAQIRHSQNGNK